MGNNIHLAIDRDSATAVVFDPAWESEAILQFCQQQGVTLKAVLLTHGHDDHINAVEPLRHQLPIETYISTADAEHFGLTQYGWTLFQPPFQLALGESWIEAIATPGHTPGGTCYRLDNHLITGDTLFVFGCGRCDLPGGDSVALYHSLQMLTTTLPPETRIYPGHNYSSQPTSTLAEEIVGNPFLQCNDVTDFIPYRMVQHDRERNAPYGPVTA